jgi:hypothetical protein
MLIQIKTNKVKKTDRETCDNKAGLSSTWTWPSPVRLSFGSNQNDSDKLTEESNFATKTEHHGFLLHR